MSQASILSFSICWLSETISNLHHKNISQLVVDIIIALSLTYFILLETKSCFSFCPHACFLGICIAWTAMMYLFETLNYGNNIVDARRQKATHIDNSKDNNSV